MCNGALSDIFTNPSQEKKWRLGTFFPVTVSAQEL